MSVTTLARAILSALLFGSASISHAALVEVSPGSLTAAYVVDFEDQGLAPGTFANHDGVLESGFTQFSERFAGQTNTEVLIGFEFFDTLSGSPTDPLTLANGPSLENLTVGNLGGNHGLSGESSTKALGQGAIAVLFDFDQSQVAFDALGIDIDGFGEAQGENLVASFFARDGSSLGVFNLNLDGATAKTFAFATDDSAFEIAGFSLTNDNLGGLGFDNFVHDVQGVQGPGQVPLPGAVWLFASALGALAYRRKL